MPRTAAGPAGPQELLDIEIARLSSLDVEALRARWRTLFRQRAPIHVPRHLLIRILAYRLQVDDFGDLDLGLRKLLEHSNDALTIAQLVTDLERIRPGLPLSTVLTREWNGEMQQVIVQPDGFSWRGKTYRSLTMVAYAITGTKWNGPRFFGLRDQSGSRT
jgi:hypothetical protein